jgi:hypothetical protein
MQFRSRAGLRARLIRIIVHNRLWSAQRPTLLVLASLGLAGLARPPYEFPWRAGRAGPIQKSAVSLPVMPDLIRHPEK